MVFMKSTQETVVFLRLVPFAHGAGRVRIGIGSHEPAHTIGLPFVASTAWSRLMMAFFISLISGSKGFHDPRYLRAIEPIR